MFKEFINEWGYQLIFAIATAVAGYIGTQLKRIYESKVNDSRKKKFAEDSVKAVEQVYKNLHGEEKFNKALECLTERLNQEGINWTKLECELLIESVVLELNKPWIEDGANG